MSRIFRALRLPHATMFINYFKILLRTLKKSRVYASISILSLFLGLTCATLIFVYVQKELNFDRFYPDAGRIYRIAYDRIGNGTIRHIGFAPMPLTPYLRDNYEAVEEVTRVFNYRRAVPVTIPETQASFNEPLFGWVDSTYFQVFDIDFIAGNPETALDRPYSIVLSESTAKKYFGDEDPVGKIVQFNWDATSDLEVTGIYEDFPTNSHFRFDLLSNLETASKAMWVGLWFQSWANLFVSHYLKVKPGADVEYLQTESDRIVDDKWPFETIELDPVFQPLTSIHLYSHLDLGEFNANGNISNLYLFGVIGLIILFLGCFNFMNMVTSAIRVSLQGNRSSEDTRKSEMAINTTTLL